MITDERLDEWERLCADAVSPGPWAYDENREVVSCPLGTWSRGVVAHVTNSKNGEFVATSRDAMPALIAEVRRLRKRDLAATLVDAFFRWSKGRGRVK